MKNSNDHYKSKQIEYKTKQKELILDYLKSHGDKHVTIDDVFGYLRLEGHSVGRTTVYRYMERLTDTGTLRKYYIEEGMGACYQFIGNNNQCCSHFHLKCTKCGTLIHMECEYLNKINEHILQEHHFLIDNTKTVFYGLCKKCQNK